MLLEKLPPGSSFIAAVRGGDEYLGWDRPAYMAADIFDAIEHLAHMYSSAHSKTAPKKPSPYPRPGAEETRKKVLKNPLTAALKGEETITEVAPGMRIPLPPRK